MMAMSQRTEKAWTMAGANVKLQNELGNTALHLAAFGNYIQTVILLAEGGASVKTKNTDSQTPLHGCSQSRLQGNHNGSPVLYH